MNLHITVTKLAGRNRWAVRRIDSHKGRDSVVGYIERKFKPTDFERKFNLVTSPYVFKQDAEGFGYVGGLTSGELQEMATFIESLGE